MVHPQALLDWFGKATSSGNQAASPNTSAMSSGAPSRRSWGLVGDGRKGRPHPTRHPAHSVELPAGITLAPGAPGILVSFATHGASPRLRRDARDRTGSALDVKLEQEVPPGAVVLRLLADGPSI
jgi:hypothetical protein